MTKAFRKISFVISIAIALLPIALGIDIYTYPQEELRESADAAIVLGAAIWEAEPSPVFRERLNHAVNLYKTEKVKKVILTGGVGEKDKFAEAEVGEKYLIENGVPATDILKETQSRTTFQNLKNSIPILSENNLQSVLIISDPLHLRRAVKMAKDLDLDAFPAPTPTTRYQSFASQFSFLSREIYFYLVYLIFGI